MAAPCGDPESNMNPLTQPWMRLATCLAMTLLPALAPAQAAAAVDPAVVPPRTGLTPSRETGRLYVDSSDRTQIWARGDTWKASFAAAGLTFVPFLGSDAPRNYPLHLQLDGATLDGAALPLDLLQAPRHDRDGITLARGSCTEVYELSPGHIEQRFVFEQPLRGGELAVHMRVRTELAVAATGDGGFRFTNERGGVHYGRAIAYDAAGQHTEVRSTCDGDHLVLTVPAHFLGNATFPLTIDPVISYFGVPPGRPAVTQWMHPDCAYLGSHDGLHAVVFEEVYSQIDHDVYLRPYGGDLAMQNGAYVDFTSAHWAVPQIASHRGASQFLVVAEVGAPTGTSQIWGRLITYATNAGATVLTLGAQFPVQASGNGKNPDVGGDPNPSPTLPGNFCVTWTGQSNGELYYNIVRTDGSLGASSGAWLDMGPEIVSNPRVAKSCGVGAANLQEWVVVWQKRYSPTDEDIYGTVIGVDGVVRTLQFPIDTSTLSDRNPEVSSPTDFIDGAQRYVVVYQRDVPPIGVIAPAHEDIFGQLWTGTTALSGPQNLSQLLLTTTLDDQLDPCVDTDGTRFAIGFTEDVSIFTNDVVPYLATLHVTGTQLAVTAYPELTNAFAGADERMQVCAERSGGTFTPRYMAVWDVSDPSIGLQSAEAAFYDGYTNLGPGGPFNYALPGCGTLALTATGLPALSNTFFLDLSGAQGLPFLLVGTSVAPVSMCPGCELGIDQATMTALFTASWSMTVPNWSSLIGYQIAAQGLDLFAPGACSTPAAFALSNEIIITLL